MHCSKCGGAVVGDGYTVVFHCENTDESVYEDHEPDASPVYCTEEAGPKPLTCWACKDEGCYRCSDIEVVLSFQGLARLKDEIEREQVNPEHNHKYLSKLSSLRTAVNDILPFF